MEGQVGRGKRLIQLKVVAGSVYKAQLAGQQLVPPQPGTQEDVVRTSSPHRLLLDLQPRNRLMFLWLSEQLLEAFMSHSTSRCSDFSRWISGQPGSSVTGCFLIVVTS